MSDFINENHIQNVLFKEDLHEEFNEKFFNNTLDELLLETIFSSVVILNLSNFLNNVLKDPELALCNNKVLEEKTDMVFELYVEIATKFLLYSKI